MSCVLDLPTDILQHIAAQFGFLDTRSIRMMETALPVFGKKASDGLSICSYRCKELFQDSLTETRINREISWMDNVMECKYDMCADLCGVAYKLRSGRVVMWRQGKRALYGALSLKDYRWLSRNIGPMIDTYLVSVTPSTFRTWSELEQGYRLRFQYEQSLYLMVDNCLQAIEEKVRPLTFVKHLNAILKKRRIIEQECSIAREIREKVVLYYQRERKNYCLADKHSRQIKLE